MLAAAADGAASDYDTQGMALKLKELDEDLKKYETRTYPCEAHLTWCETSWCTGSVQWRSGAVVARTTLTTSLRGLPNIRM